MRSKEGKVVVMEFGDMDPFVLGECGPAGGTLEDGREGAPRKPVWTGLALTGLVDMDVAGRS